MRLFVLATLLITPLAARPLYFERQSSTLYRARVGGQTLTFHPDSFEIGRVTLQFVNASPAASLSGAGNSAPVTYIQGAVTRTFRQFPKLALRRVYPGIDVEFYGNGENLEYDLVVSPGVDLQRVRMHFDGAGKLELDRQGNLGIESERGSFTQMLPRVFQSDGRPVKASYVLLANHQVGFRVGRHNPRLALTIDPELVFTKYFGGSGTDAPKAIASDAQGNIYIAGTSNSIDLPTTNGFQVKVPPPLAAISANGATIAHLPVGSESSILAIGGNSDGSVLYAIAPDATYVSSDHGATWTQNAPLQSTSSTPGISSLLTPPTINNISVDAADPSRAFVATSRGLFFTSQGGQGWYLYDYQLPSGPNGPVNASWVAISPIDHLTTYVATTQPPGLFKTTNAGVTWTQLTLSYPGQSLSFAPYPYVATLAPNGTDLLVIDANGTLVKSTDGGSTWQVLSPQHYGAPALVIDPSNASNVYLLDYAGIEASSDGGITFTKLLGTPGPQGSTNRLAVDPNTGALYFTATGGNVIYVIPAGGGSPQLLQLSTPDIHTLVTVGSQVYAGFDTPTVPFVAKWDPSQTLPPAASTVGFAAKLSAAGDRLLAGTYLGGSYSSIANAAALDAAGNIYLTGSSAKILPGATPGAYQSTPVDTCAYPFSIGPSLPYGGTNDAFVLKLDPTLSTPGYLTYLGGGCNDSGNGIALDAAGNAWITGNTQSTDFPLKAPLQSGGPSFQFVSEISADGSQLLFSSATDGTALAIDPAGTINLAGPGSTPAIAKRPSALFSNGTSVEWSRINAAMTPPVVIDSIQPVNAFPPAILNPSYPGKNVAPGELVRITGRNFGPATQVNGQLDATGRLPFTLAGITVLFDKIPAPIVSASEGTIMCFAPFEIRSTTNITLESSGGQSNPVRVGVLPSDLQVLTVTNQDGTPNSASNPAKPGDVLIFYVSGLGLTSPLSADGLSNTPPLAVPIAQVMVYLPMKATQPDFIGPAPGQIAGITQINVRLPAGNYTTNPITIGFNQANAEVYVTQ